MKMPAPSTRSSAFTRLELVLVIGLLMVLAILFLPALAKSRRHTTRIGCVSNLKNIGLAFRIYSNDHGDRFPMEASPTEKSAHDFSTQASVFKFFLTLSNELATPKLLTCPLDNRKATDSFAKLSNSNLSYFIGLDASQTAPQSLLAGDRNITNGIAPERGILDLLPTQPAGWTDGIHGRQGFVVLGDGSVLQLNDARLREQLSNSGNATNRILLPE